MKLIHLLSIVLTQTLIKTIYSGGVLGKNKVPVLGGKELPCGEAFREPSVPRHINGRRFQSIVGGVESRNGSWPWMVKITIAFKNPIPDPNRPNGPKILVDAVATCSGTIVDKYWILAAAHSFQKRGISKITIDAGDVFPSKNYGVHRTIVELKSYIPYDRNDKGHDAVLIKVNMAFTFSKESNINKVCLPKAMGTINTKSECYTMGWGRTYKTHDTDIPKESQDRPLKEMNLVYTDKKEFLGNKRLGANLKNLYSNQPIICSKNSLTTYPYFGDSGSPFLCRVKKTYTTYGVLSGPCSCLDDEITIFADVSNIVTWINSVIA